ncbi:MAG: flagellar biosynthetic protein FliQ [Nannocystaceae bacterium]
MTPEFMLEVVNRAIWLAAECAGPLLVIGGGTGLFMAIVQAATQISEPAITFIPKIVSLGLAFVLLGGWLVTKIVEFNVQMYETIATVGP